jgi:hypothetical protein
VTDVVRCADLQGLIRRVLVASPFAGAWFGHRIGKGDPHVGEQPQRAGQELPIAAALGGQQEDRGVLRQLGGQSLEELPRDLQVEAHRLAAWQDEFACVNYYPPRPGRMWPTWGQLPTHMIRPSARFASDECPQKQPPPTGRLRPSASFLAGRSLSQGRARRGVGVRLPVRAIGRSRPRAA